MENLVPGQLPTPTKAERKASARVQFPKAVYGKSLEDCKIIQCEEERPDGYVDFENFSAAPPADDLPKTDAADAAKAEAKKAEKAYRDGIKEYLDANAVDYAKNLSTSKLEALKVALDAHLAPRNSEDDAE